MHQFLFFNESQLRFFIKKSSKFNQFNNFRSVGPDSALVVHQNHKKGGLPMKETINGSKKNILPTVFDLSGNQCVWAAAGVIQPRPCISAYDCMSCAFDKKLKREFSQGKIRDNQGRPILGWCDPTRYAFNSNEEHKCRHMLSGRIPVRYCINNYECSHCEFDQELDDLGLLGPGPKPELEPELELVAGFAKPKRYYFHRGHTWARLEYGGRLRVGLDDFALRLLGPLDEIRLPELGQAVCQGQAEFALRRGQKEARVMSPLKGVVVAVNPEIRKNPTKIQEAPYSRGWLFVVTPTRLTPNLHDLMFGEESTIWLDREAGRLSALVAEETGYRLAATGGRVVEDIYGRLPKLGWEHLVHDFLLT
jgi:glycine cleavage system H lipoate-binding protein